MTESFWNTIGLRVYAVQSAAYDWVVLVVGVSITATSYLAVIIGRRTYISKVIKQH
jgi:nicastrin